MLLYDYQCNQCQMIFEVSASLEEKAAGIQPECPQCHSLDTQQVLTAGTVLHSIGEITAAVAAAALQPETGGRE